MILFRVIGLLFAIVLFWSTIAVIVEIERDETEWAQDFRKGRGSFAAEVIGLILSILALHGAVIKFLEAIK